MSTSWSSRSHPASQPCGIPPNAIGSKNAGCSCRRWTTWCCDSSAPNYRERSITHARDCALSSGLTRKRGDEHAVVIEKPSGISTVRHPAERDWLEERRLLVPTLDDLVLRQHEVVQRR